MDYMNPIHHHMFRPEELRKELDDYHRPVQRDRSIDDCLESTETLTQWALRKAPQYDPENRRPLPSPNDSPLSDYDIEFTRLNKTDQGQSSLSSLHIPTASNTSLSVLNNVTPRENVLNRKSSQIPKKSGNLTPSLLIRHKQSINIGLAGRQSQPRRTSFEPPLASTPILAQRKRPSIFGNLAGAEGLQNRLGNNLTNVQSPVQHDTPTNNANTSAPKDGTYRKVTRASQVDESELTLVPTAKSPNGSVIPEMQHDQAAEAQKEQRPETERCGYVSSGQTTPIAHNARTINANASTPRDRTYRKMTQGSQIDGSDLTLVPGTQPPNRSVIIPETQDDRIPETQDEPIPNAERNNSILYTPTRSQRKRFSRINNISEDESSNNITDDESAPSDLLHSISQLRSPNGFDTHTINRNTLTLRNETYRKSTPANHTVDGRSISVPETQPANESVIPETQEEQIPETQDDQIPETRQEQTQETEQNVSASNARPSDKRDTLTATQSAPIPVANKSKLVESNLFVRLSPLRMDELSKKYNIDCFTAPMDLDVITPPRNFQNSRRASQIENDDNLIVEASPSTCALRKQQLEQRNFDQSDADLSDSTLKPTNSSGVQRKRGRRETEHPELMKLQNIPTSSKHHSLPRNSKGRRLTSFDALRNDFDNDHGTDVEQNIVVTPITSTSDQAADDNLFKVPEVPRRKSSRKSKADNFKRAQKRAAEDPIANENENGNANVNTIPDADEDTDTDPNADANENGNASAPRRPSDDSFNFSVHMQPMNDSSIQAYMTENDASIPVPDPPKSSSAKSKGQKPKAAAKVGSKTKSKPKPVQNDVAADDVPTFPRRRPSRDSHRNDFVAEYLNMIKLPAPKSKRRLKSPNTAPVTDRRTETNPPKKKLRTEPEIRRRTKRPTDVIGPLKKSGKSLPPSQRKSKANQSTSSSFATKTGKSMPRMSSKSKSTTDQTSASATSQLANFVTGLTEKQFKSTEFWKDINDYNKDNEIVGEDVLYIKTKDGTIEASTHKQIDYFDIDGVKYGFVPSKNKRFGLMRFQPGAKKAYEKSTGIIYLFVLQGCFEVRGADGELQLQSGSETKIDNGVFYEITNKGKKTAIIQFEYSEHIGDASE